MDFVVADQTFTLRLAVRQTPIFNTASMRARARKKWRWSIGPASKKGFPAHAIPRSKLLLPVAISECGISNHHRKDDVPIGRLIIVVQRISFH